MRYQGRITRWNDDRGFGYITPNGGGDDLFVHASALVGWRGRPAGGEIVTYGKASDTRGRPCANEVRLVDMRPARAVARPASSGHGAWWVLGIFLVTLVGAVVYGRLPAVVPLVYGAMSALAFVVYGLDKSAAMLGRWRTSEQSLHLLALAGGWPGALVAQRRLRHKSSKSSFQRTFWVTVIINIAVLIWLASKRGAAFLESVLGG